jgi:hypothetical protein
MGSAFVLVRVATDYEGRERIITNCWTLAAITKLNIVHKKLDTINSACILNFYKYYEQILIKFPEKFQLFVYLQFESAIRIHIL